MATVREKEGKESDSILPREVIARKRRRHRHKSRRLRKKGVPYCKYNVHLLLKIRKRSVTVPYDLDRNLIVLGKVNFPNVLIYFLSRYYNLITTSFT